MTGFWAWFHDGWEIAGAMAAAGAVIVALVLANRDRADREQAEAERDAAEAELKAERRAAAENARRAQAERVVGWFQRVVASSTRLASGDTLDIYKPVVRVGNYSNAPVFDVRVVAVRLRDNETFRVNPLSVLPPTEKPLEVNVEGSFAASDEDVHVAVTFRDVAGVHWRRLYDGRLEELQGD